MARNKEKKQAGYGRRDVGCVAIVGLYPFAQNIHGKGSIFRWPLLDFMIQLGGIARASKKQKVFN